MLFVKLAAFFVLAWGVAFLVSLLAAQFVVWGLSIMGVSSGIWGPGLILAGVSMVAGTSAAVVSRGK